MMLRMKLWNNDLCPCCCQLRSAAEIASGICDVCDEPGCWRRNPGCPYYGRAPEDHPDAALGDNVPHMVQREIRFEGQTVFIDNQPFHRGLASGEDNNCLIDTVRQSLHVVGVSLANVRLALQSEFDTPGPARVEPSNYLTLELHWERVLHHVAHEGQRLGLLSRLLSPAMFRIVAVDWTHRGNGDVVGNGEHTLYIARENQNHFVPLFPGYARENPMNPR